MLLVSYSYSYSYHRFLRKKTFCFVETDDDEDLNERNPKRESQEKRKGVVYVVSSAEDTFKQTNQEKFVLIAIDIEMQY